LIHIISSQNIWPLPKDLEVRKTLNFLTQRPESLAFYVKDFHPKMKPLKDLLGKDIALRDVVP